VESSLQRQTNPKKQGGAEFVLSFCKAGCKGLPASQTIKNNLVAEPISAGCRHSSLRLIVSLALYLPGFRLLSIWLIGLGIS